MESRLGNEGKEEKHKIFFSETGNKDGSLIHRGAAWKSLEGCRGAVHLTANGRSRLREGMTVMSLLLRSRGSRFPGDMDSLASRGR
jgi:hypothetical protein